ncbi:Non-reducing polyketide synthase terA [Lachnellula suecica]|uniref:Non-reducing polyketide synthase terA n=1 Tax=Lachnellula suecica TaxID=602035 RepID=A0A8T9CJ26_9HELO|nr:Non-reducing polyketide synthase terA [Lachnellula suecica]
MAGAFEVLLFGDETGDFREPLKKLCDRRKGVVFLHFIERLNETLRDEVHQQPRHVQDQIPPFTDIAELVKHYHESGKRNPILETTLACICQLASVIAYYDDHPSQYIVPADSAFVGLCTGLLAATAVSASQSLLGLVPIALKIIRVAFRIGVKVNGAAKRLSPSQDANVSQNWSTLVVGVQKEAAAAEIAQFNKIKGMPKASQAYVSSNSRDIATISGPPETLKALFLESESFRKRKSVQLDIYGPFHASHLYSAADIDEILLPITESNIKLITPLIPVISGATGESLPEVGMDQFMRTIVNEILIRPMSFDNILAAIASEAKDSGKSTCKVSSVGPSNAANSLVSALRAGTELEVNVGEQLGITASGAKVPNKSAKIAIVGMSGRFPSGADLESFWSVLEQGLDLHRRVPADRFDIDAHYDPTGKKKNTSITPYGCFIEEPGLFDPKFFNMSPREAYQTDPMQRLGITTAFEALEMSGFVANRTPSSMLNRVGTFYGQTSDDWRQVNAAETIDTYYIPGTIRAFAPGRINYHFKFSGPSYSVDTACSSSFSAIQLACTSLRAKECDTAVAGGLNVMTASDLFAGLSRAQFLSKTGSCKTFDDDADGFCRGDGVGTVILKRLEDAEMDNDPILGVILGVSTNHSANAVSITQPHPETQEILYKRILNDTGVDCNDVSYVEMHGTGTQAGDGAEMKSISNVFAPRNKLRAPGQTLHLGALKANIGHGEASAGVASLIKVLMMLKRNTIPPHVGIKGVINHTFPDDLEERGVRIAFKETPWVAPTGGKRRAYVNNFSAAGGNTGLLLEEAPSQISGDIDPRSTFVVAASGRTAVSLKKNIQKLVAFLDENPDTSLPSLSYTTMARRIQHPFRVSFPVTSISEAKAALLSASDDVVKAVSAKAPKVFFVFTGQGSHYPMLGQQLFEDSKQFRSDILDFDQVGRSQGFPSFLPLIDGSVTDMESLSSVVVQLGLSCIQMALARLWISWGISPSAVLGHSLGEYAALNISGVLSVSDTIFLVGRRAELLEENCTAGTHAMLAVGASLESIEKILVGEEPEVACINGPRETVISGLAKQMDSYSKTLKAAGLKCLVLPTAFAFHSTQVASILESFQKSASSITFQDPAVPVISPLLGEVVNDGDVFGPEYLSRHARETVDFQGALAKAKQDGLIAPNTVWIEIGPAPVCSAFIKSNLGTEMVTVPSLRKKEDVWKTITSGLSSLHRNGVDFDWNEVYRGYGSDHKVLLLPRYSFDTKNYWLDYHNDWALTKGDLIEAPTQKVKAIDRKVATTTVQKIVSENFGETITVVGESDLSEPQLNSAIFGHLVNGSGLVPSSIYSDMAITVAGYMYRKIHKSEGVGIDVRHLEISKPIIPKESKGKQIVRITATADKSLKLVTVNYNTPSSDGTWELHATCNVEFGDTKSWVADWSRVGYLIRSRMDVMAQGLKTGVTKKTDRAKTYELFSALVQYSKKYLGMKEVILDSKNFEASSIVEFQATDKDGEFEVNPYWIDNIAHISGFVLNGSDAVDSKKTVYISHGWESCRIARPLEAKKTYSNYVRMQADTKHTMVGDVYVFDKEDMVALITGVKFQAIPRAVLNKLLPPANGYKFSPAAKTDNVAIPKTITNTSAASVPTPMVNGTGGNAAVKEFVSIIAAELGMEPSELTDAAEFTDIGVDSLMSLSITGRIREELDMDVPVSLFTDHPTIGEAKAAILALKGPSQAPQAPVQEAIASVQEPTRAPVQEAPSAPMAHSSQGDAASAIAQIVSIIADELGEDPSDLADDAEFSDIGVDSLMSLSITGRIREELDLDVPVSLFTDYPTIGEAKAAVATLMGKTLNESAAPNGNAMPNGSATTNGTNGHATQEQSPAASEVKPRNEKANPPATSILLQGNPKKAKKILFLFPDGSGSATSYALFPTIAPGVCVYGLNCPFMKTPADYTNGIEGVAAQYLTEIKRRQPRGPYTFGGWSAGGVLAYQVACKLIEMGEKVDRLILIDSPCPIKLEPLPSSLLHFVDSMGLLGSQNSGRTPEWLIPHFEASVANLTAYNPQAMDARKAPKTFVIWARDGLCKNPEDQKMPRSADEAKSIAFLLDNRVDFGSNGWGKLVGEENITAVNTEGNHFTMIREPTVKKMAGLLRRGLGIDK